MPIFAYVKDIPLTHDPAAKTETITDSKDAYRGQCMNLAPRSLIAMPATRPTTTFSCHLAEGTRINTDDDRHPKVRLVEFKLEIWA